MLEVEASARFRIARKARVQPDPRSGKLALLSPESLLLLNDSGAAIVELLDGQRTVAEVSGLLADRFAAEPLALRADVQRYLGKLLERRLIERVPNVGET